MFENELKGYLGKNLELEDDTLDRIEAISEKVDFEKNTIILNLDRRQEYLYLMIEGLARSYYIDEKARDITKLFIKEGENKAYHPKEEVWEWKGNQIHLDRFPNPKAKAKIICLHGVGTNGRLISMIMGGPMAKAGYETISPDMPTYGISKVNPDMKISYKDWVECGSDLIDRELERDSRPIFLYGLSAGGMQAYHVACKNGSDRIKAIIGMTFLESYMNYCPEIEGEDFDLCPILLTQPEEDRWIPKHLSEIF